MKNNILKYIASVVAVLGLTATVHATPIAGSIGFAGTWTQNGGTLGNLTSLGVTSVTIATAAVNSQFGAFVGAVNAGPVFYSPINVSLTPSDLVGNTLWTVTIGTTVFRLSVLSETQTELSSTQYSLKGSGILSDGIAADNTLGTWQMGFGVSGQSFSWQSTATNVVPDGGTSAILLGAALSGLALIRRKLA